MSAVKNCVFRRGASSLSTFSRKEAQAIVGAKGSERELACARLTMVMVGGGDGTLDVDARCQRPPRQRTFGCLGKGSNKSSLGLLERLCLLAWVFGSWRCWGGWIVGRLILSGFVWLTGRVIDLAGQKARALGYCNG